MHKMIRYILIFVSIGIFISTAMGDAFNQTVNQIKSLEVELEQNQIDIEAKQTFIEEELSTEFADHALKAPKGEFESDADYQDRQRQLTGIIAERRTGLKEEHLSLLRVRRLEIQTELGRSRRTVFFTHDFSVILGAYDANTERFPIEFKADIPSFHKKHYLYVNKNDAPSLKNNWDQVIKTAYISIDPGYRRALAWVKLEYPSLWGDEGMWWRYHRVYYLGDNSSIAFSPDGKYIAAGSSNEQGIATERGIATIWKVEDGEKFRRLDHGDWVYAVAFSPDGKYFATGGEDELGDSWEGKVVLWNMINGAKVQVFNHDNEVESGVFSPNGNYLATVSLPNSWEGRVVLWHVNSGKKLWYSSYNAKASTISALTFTPNGSYLAAGNVRPNSWEVDNTIFWRLNGDASLYFEHHNGVYDVAFSPDGAYLATGNEGSVTLWEMRSGQRVRHIEMPDRTAYAVAFSPDGTYLAVLAGWKKEAVYNMHFFRIGTEAITFETVIPEVKAFYVGTKSRDMAWHPHGNLVSDGRSVYRTLLEPIVKDLVAKPLETRRDVNRDGVVDVDDLVLVASNFGKSFAADANPNPDVNLDGIVNRADIIEIIISLESAPGAPSVHSRTIPTLTAENLQYWIDYAKSFDNPAETFQKGIRVLEQLLATFTAEETLPEETSLLPNYPNPFNPETWIPYQLAEPAAVKISIHAADGKLVRTLDLGHQDVGIYESRNRAAYWDGRNAQGESVASGVYFFTLKVSGDFSATRRMLIQK